MAVSVTDFGTTKKGEQVHLYSLKNENGMEAVVSEYGAVLVKLIVPDKNDNPLDVVLGYDEVAGYEDNGIYLGATIGRNANRIGKCRFMLNGTEYTLDKNDGNNNLHGGFDGYNTRVWKAEILEEGEEPSIRFSLESPDGDQGFPGKATVAVTYTVTAKNWLKLDYEAQSDKDTLMNLTNHSYFNLNGHKADTILDQELWINAESYTAADEESIPTGDIVPVDNSPMDFRTMKPIGRDIEKDYEAIKFGAGYDHNYVLENKGQFKVVAKLDAKQSGISMEVITDLPGMQLYTGNFLKGDKKGKENVYYKRRSGVCLETQYFPDAINHENFIPQILKAGELYKTTTAYRFTRSKER